jgi:ABC-type multidrug transport system ATPase subunit
MASLYRLTVYEHLWFFARLKNQPEDGLSEQIEQMILDLGIPHKRYLSTSLYSVDVWLLIHMRVIQNV